MQYIFSRSVFEALVVKASGLAAGKGVFVCADREEAARVVEDVLTGGVVGSAGNTVIVEEWLEGQEVSVRNSFYVS